MSHIYLEKGFFPLPDWRSLNACITPNRQDRQAPSLYNDRIFHFAEEKEAISEEDKIWLCTCYAIEIVAGVALALLVDAFFAALSFVFPLVLVFVPLELALLAISGHGFWNGALLLKAIWDQEFDSSISRMQKEEAALQALSETAIKDRIHSELTLRECDLQLDKWRQINATNPYHAMTKVLAAIIVKKREVEGLMREHDVMQNFFYNRQSTVEAQREVRANLDLPDPIYLEETLKTFEMLRLEAAKKWLEMGYLTAILRDPSLVAPLESIGAFVGDMIGNVVDLRSREEEFYFAFHLRNPLTRELEGEEDEREEYLSAGRILNAPLRFLASDLFHELQVIETEET